MHLNEIRTPALVLDRAKLEANTSFMTARGKTLGVELRPHMKTAKSAEVAKLATHGQPGGITVSTLREARYFLDHGFTDITYAVGLDPHKIGEAISLVADGAQLRVLTDHPGVAHLITEECAQVDLPRALEVLIEVDCGDGRGGVPPASDVLVEIAGVLDGKPNVRLAGVLTHAGQSYECESIAEIEEVAERERDAAVRSAETLRKQGHDCAVVSVGSTPTATHARDLSGVTEMRPGVYMFGDLDQVGLRSLPVERVAVTVLASVIGCYPARGAVVLDAGGLALSKDRSAARHDPNVGYGYVLDLHGQAIGASVAAANQEHGILEGGDLPFEKMQPGTKVRVLPNHICMTAAAHPAYHVVDGGTEVIARWERINGW